MYMKPNMSVTLKSFVVYFRSHFQPLLYFIDENSFEDKICLIDKVSNAMKSKNISSYVFPFAYLFVQEDGSGGSSRCGDCVN